MEKTELISFRERYEKETGMVSHQYGGVPREEYVTWLERENAKLEAKLTEVLEIQTVEKFQEIIRNQCDEILALKDQLRWRPVSEKPKESDRYIVKYRQGKIVKKFIADYDIVLGWNMPLPDVEIIEWLPIPPAPEGVEG